MGQISIENARVELASNPLLPAGEYKLYVPERPDSIHVYGVVNAPGDYRYASGKTVADWLNSIDDSEGLGRPIIKAVLCVLDKTSSSQQTGLIINKVTPNFCPATFSG